MHSDKPQIFPSGKQFSVQYLAKEWGVSRRHVQRLIASGLLGVVRIGRVVRIPQTEAERFLAERWVAPNASEARRHRCSASSGNVASIADGIIDRQRRSA
jgi:excisionase family DNA binding protein